MKLTATLKEYLFLYKSLCIAHKLLTVALLSEIKLSLHRLDLQKPAVAIFDYTGKLTFYAMCRFLPSL